MYKRKYYKCSTNLDGRWRENSIDNHRREENRYDRVDEDHVYESPERGSHLTNSDTKKRSLRNDNNTFGSS